MYCCEYVCLVLAGLIRGVCLPILRKGPNKTKTLHACKYWAWIQDHAFFAFVALDKLAAVIFWKALDGLGALVAIPGANFLTIASALALEFFWLKKLPSQQNLVAIGLILAGSGVCVVGKLWD